jgi:hypothetical protein
MVGNKAHLLSPCSRKFNSRYRFIILGPGKSWHRVEMISWCVAPLAFFEKYPTVLPQTWSSIVGYFSKHVGYFLRGVCALTFWAITLLN